MSKQHINIDVFIKPLRQEIRCHTRHLLYFLDVVLPICERFVLLCTLPTRRGDREHHGLGVAWRRGSLVARPMSEAGDAS